MTHEVTLASYLPQDDNMWVAQQLGITSHQAALAYETGLKKIKRYLIHNPEIAHEWRDTIQKLEPRQGNKYIDDYNLGIT